MDGQGACDDGVSGRDKLIAEIPETEPECPERTIASGDYKTNVMGMLSGKVIDIHTDIQHRYAIQHPLRYTTSLYNTAIRHRYTTSAFSFRPSHAFFLASCTPPPLVYTLVHPQLPARSTAVPSPRLNPTPPPSPVHHG